MRRSIELERNARKLTLIETSKYDIADLWAVRYEPIWIKNWFRVKGLTNSLVEADFSVGGTWRIVQTGELAVDYALYGVVKQIVPHRLVEFSLIWEVIPNIEMHVTNHFYRVDGRSQVVTQYLFPDDDAVEAFSAADGVTWRNEISKNYGAMMRKLHRQKVLSTSLPD